MLYRKGKTMSEQQQSTQQATDATDAMDIAAAAAAAEKQQAKKVYKDLTPYEAYKVAEVQLRKAGVTHVKMAPQPMYSRASKGVIKSYRVRDDGSRDETKQEGKWFFDGADFARWLKAFIDGYVTGTTGSRRRDYAALADEYEI